MALLLLQKNGTLNHAHPHQGSEGPRHPPGGGHPISAVDSGFVTEDMVKDGAVVIDVAMNRNAEGSLRRCGLCRRIEKALALSPPYPVASAPYPVSDAAGEHPTACRQQNGL